MAERTGAAATDTELTDGLSATLSAAERAVGGNEVERSRKADIRKAAPSMAVGGKTILRLTPALQAGTFDSSGFQQVTSISASAGAPLKETE